MDLKRLRYFVTVARMGSFTQASALLRMAQPPLSQRVQELEVEVGSVLINRDTRPLTLTPAGRVFFQHATQVLQKTDAMMATMRRLLTDERRTLNLGVLPQTFHGNLAGVIREYRRVLPDVDVRILELNSMEQAEALLEGRIDAGISRVEIVSDGVRRLILNHEPMVVALPFDHPLATQEDPMPLDVLQDEPFIVYTSDPRPSLADHILRRLAERKIILSNIIEVRQFDTALILIAAGSGLSLVPASARLTASPGVTYRSLLDPITSPIVLCHREDDTSMEVQVLHSVVAQFLDDRAYTRPFDVKPG